MRQVALITGISRGIGFQIARRLIAEQIMVVGLSTHPGQAEQALAKNSPETRSLVRMHPVDVTDFEQTEKIVAETVHEFGQLDVLVNNAGIGVFGPLWRITPQEWERVLTVNLSGPYYCIRSVMPQMLLQKHGVVINISSLCGLSGHAENAAYCSSKFGLQGLTEALAKDLAAHDIRVYGICPDVVDTGFSNNRNAAIKGKIPFLQPEWIAEVVWQLIRKRPPSQILKVYRGLTARVLFRLGFASQLYSVRRLKCL